MHTWKQACCGALMAVAAFSAAAGYEDGMQAVQKKDFPVAVKEFRAAAEAGDKRAYYPLGALLQQGLGTPADKPEGYSWLMKAAEAGLPAAINAVAWSHIMGEGVPKDYKTGLAWAMKTAELGNAEGQYNVYLAILLGELRYIGDNGKPDTGKYRQLATRPVAERKNDILAYEMLYRSAVQGHRPAMIFLATLYADNVGTENRRRLQELEAKLTPSLPHLKNVAARAKELDRLGETLTTPKIAIDAQLTALLAARIAAGGIGKDKNDECDLKQSKLVGMKVSKPLTGAEYLPIAIPELAQAYLLKGEWQEEWTYEMCGKSVAVPMKFQADGFGGAFFQTESRPLKAN